MSISPYMQGNFEPQRQEYDHPDLEITGALPPDLQGTYLRNGPNPQFRPPGRYHWCEGDGMVHGVTLRQGKASYRNRYVRTEVWATENAAGQTLLSGFASPDQEDQQSVSRNRSNAALLYHHGRLLSLWEGGRPYELSLPGLETEGPYDFGGKLRHAFTAHPRVDPETGELMFFGYSYQAPFLHYGIADREGQVVHSTALTIPEPALMHDFAITEHHTIFAVFPMFFRPERLAQGRLPLVFEESTPARYALLPRHGGDADLQWYEGPPCFAFHFANAFEEGEDVVLEGCRMARASVRGIVHIEQPTPQPAMTACHTEEMAQFCRWRFRRSRGSLTEERLDEIPTDLPRINEAWTGRKNRYTYCCLSSPALTVHDAVTYGGLVKYDRETGRKQTHHFGHQRYGGEGLFVPRPGGTAEDDGWVLTLVHDETTHKDELRVIAAQDFASPPVARVHVPTRVPYGFHGTWIPRRR